MPFLKLDDNHQDWPYDVVNESTQRDRSYADPE